jgi:hypothetical protein
MRAFAIAAALVATLSTSASAFTVGWHGSPTQFCGWYGASGPSIFYLQTTSGDFLFSNDFADIASLQAACAHGNQIAWHVVDPATGRFDQTIIFPK